MKKLFVSLMAVAALVSCNNENEDTILTSSKKSVTISIANAVSETRALVDGAKAVTDREGSAGQLLDAGQEVVSATTDKLVFLFANDNGEIVEIRTYNDAVKGTATSGETADVHALTFHRVTEAATQIAVVKYGHMNPLVVGNNLSAVRDEAAKESANNNMELDEITLYGADLLSSAGTTCAEDGKTYNLYTAEVTVAPMFARFEISGIECTNLGEATYNMATQNWPAGSSPAVKGYDELTLNSITFGAGATYTWTPEKGKAPILYGKYDPEVEENPIRVDYQDARVLVFDPTVSAAIAKTGLYEGAYKDAANGATKMMAWNIAPQAAPAGEGENITNPLVMSVTTKAYDYTNANKTTTLTVRSLGVDNFVAGNVYRLYLSFEEGNLDNYNDGICVNVQVTVQKWQVVLVEPTFKTEPAATPAE